MAALLFSSPSLSWARQHLPSGPGVYIYKNAAGRVIYIGKANNLKLRVSSYFRSPVALGPKTQALVQNIGSIEYIEVNSELEALLLESRLIKKFSPRFNIISKDDKSPYYIHITREPFPRAVINHVNRDSLAGPFLNRFIPLRILRNFRRVAPYCQAQRPVKKPCFYSHLGLCDPCPGSGNSEEIRLGYQKNIFRLKRLLQGNFKLVRSQLLKEMQSLSADRKFEEAALYRDYLSSLDILSSSPTRPEEYLVNPNLMTDRRQAALTALSAALKPFLAFKHLVRIEMIDIAHLAGTAATASLVVAVDGQLRNDLYRHFNIKFSSRDSDVDMMREIFIRRLKRTDWPYPDLLVLDGGIPQLSILKNISSPFPVIALAKQLEILFVPSSDGYKEIKLLADNPGLHIIQNLRDEAHRFSRRLHHHRRSVDLTLS